LKSNLSQGRQINNRLQIRIAMKNRILAKFGVVSGQFKDFDLRNGQILHVGFDEGTWQFENVVGTYE
jgi:hypothetical protein